MQDGVKQFCYSLSNLIDFTDVAHTPNAINARNDISQREQSFSIPPALFPSPFNGSIIR